jgi:hypothetical protein
MWREAERGAEGGEERRERLLLPPAAFKDGGEGHRPRSDRGQGMGPHTQPAVRPRGTVTLQDNSVCC